MHALQSQHHTLGAPWLCAAELTLPLTGTPGSNLHRTCISQVAAQSTASSALVHPIGEDLRLPDLCSHGTSKSQALSSC